MAVADEAVGIKVKVAVGELVGDELADGVAVAVGVDDAGGAGEKVGEGEGVVVADGRAVAVDVGCGPRIRRTAPEAKSVR